MLALKQEDVISIFSHPILNHLHSDILDILRLSRGPIFYNPHTLFGFQKYIILKTIEKLETKLSKLPKEDLNERAYKYTIRVYKWMMDGIVLRAMAFNPNAYRILSDNRSPGFIADKKGLNDELKLLEKLLVKGKFAVLNDLTNFLRIGDISILKPGYIELREVKSKKGKNNPEKKTMSLQEKRMKKAEKMINKNICILEDGKESKVEHIPVKAKTYLNKVKDLLIKARRDGISYHEIDSAVKVTVIDFQTCKKLGISVEEKLKGFEGFPNTHEKLPFSNVDLAFCEHGEFFRGVFPPTVWKLPTKLIADLLSGRKLITVHFSLTNFYDKFIKAGFEVEHDTTPMDKDIGKKFNKRSAPLEHSRPPSAIIIRKNGWRMDLPDTIIPRIGYEFLHPDSAVELIEYTYESRTERSRGYFLPIFRNQKKLYR